MTKNDTKQLAFSMIRQARLFKAQGQADLAASLVKRARTIRAFAASMAQPQPISVPVRINRR
jgi:ribosome-binding protein aMBF1 (putative translation factor)